MTHYQLEYQTYEDKVLGAWLGKSIGGTVGAYVENHKELKHMAAEELWPAEIPPNDDLDIQLVWLEAMQALGCWLTSDDLVHWWQDRCGYCFAEYGFFLYNVQRGILPPLSGHWNNEYFRESEGCPIRSDIWGLVAPGNPALAAELAKMDGELDHSGFSVEAEQFYAAMTAQALVAESRREIIDAGLSVLSAHSRIREVVATVEKIAQDCPDFPSAWRVVLRCYGDRDASKAVTNLALMMLAWYAAGEENFTQAMVNCANSGWDSDCTAATLGGILGAWKGTALMPATWLAQLGPDLVCGIEVDHQHAPLADIGKETALIGAEMALARNPRITLRNAPQVTVRAKPAAQVSIVAGYPADPVLWAAKPTTVTLTVNNPTRQAYAGELVLVAASGTTLAPERVALNLAPDESRVLTFQIQRQDPAAPVPDKNLFQARFTANGVTVAERVFGLGGARQWLVYGPYWDMYDREKFGDDCPYAGSNGNKNIGSVGCLNDSYQIYTYLDRPYLDEATLAQRDLAEAMPHYFEIGTDLITEKAFGGWFGPAVWYLVRTFHLPEGKNLLVNTGRSGMVKVWVNGEERLRSTQQQCWAIGDWMIPIFGDGKPQRVVIKLQAPADHTAISFNMIRNESLQGHRGYSYLSDCLADIVPTVGYSL